MKTIRAFIAIPLPPAVTTALEEAGRSLAAKLPPNSVRWVRQEAMHLTLRFLGETAVDKLPAVKKGLDEITGRYTSFELRLSDLGCFPNLHRPRVIWAGVAGTANQSQLLARDIEALAVTLGWQQEERGFRPHLTIGRVKEGQRLPELAWGQALEPLVIPVTAVHLIESQLRPAGPVYTTLHTSHLKQ